MEPTKNPFAPEGGNIIDGCQWGVDTITSKDKPLDFGYGTFTWPAIPLEYQDDAGKFVPTGITGHHRAVYNGKGGCTISKFGNSAARIPNNQSDYDKDPKNYTGGFKYNP